MILSPPRQTFGLTYATRLGMAFLLLGGAFVVWLIASETNTTSTIPYAIEGGLVVLTVVFWIMIGKSALSVHDEGIRRVSASKFRTSVNSTPLTIAGSRPCSRSQPAPG